jgi:hypothetical protein
MPTPDACTNIHARDFWLLILRHVQHRTLVMTKLHDILRWQKVLLMACSGANTCNTRGCETGSSPGLWGFKSSHRPKVDSDAPHLRGHLEKVRDKIEQVQGIVCTLQKSHAQYMVRTKLIAAPMSQPILHRVYCRSCCTREAVVLLRSQAFGLATVDTPPIHTF